MLQHQRAPFLKFMEIANRDYGPVFENHQKIQNTSFSQFGTWAAARFSRLQNSNWDEIFS